MYVEIQSNKHKLIQKNKKITKNGKWKNEKNKIK